MSSCIFKTNPGRCGDEQVRIVDKALRHRWLSYEFVSYAC